jgi:FAD/FMN-containing dehydrogenase
MISSLSELIPNFKGRVVTPNHEDYEAARAIWNAMITKQPSHIAQVTSISDVQAVLAWAQTTNRPIAVRCGGHSIPGHSLIEGGVVIDMAGLNSVTVDPEARTVLVGGGCLLGQMDAATQEYGLMSPAGAISHTGAGGLILGGGLGWTMRKYGLSIDNLLSAQVVLADGTLVRTSETEYPDLFWAIRGGGGNFGIVTEFELALHSRGDVYLAANAFELKDAAVVLKAMRDYMPTAHDDLVWSAFFRWLPDFPWCPTDRVGDPVLLAPLAWLGDNEEGASVIEDILNGLGVAPLATSRGLIPYVELQQLNDELNGHGYWNYHKSGFIPKLTDVAIDTLVQQGSIITSANSQLEILAMGGAISRVADDATAFSHRQEQWPVNVCGIWRPDEDTTVNLGWVKQTFAALGEHMSVGSYMNFGGSDADQKEQTESYGPTWNRLRKIKTVYDPTNIFRNNANIPPLTGDEMASWAESAHA